MPEIPVPLKKTFEITIDGVTFDVTFRQATMAQANQRSSLFAERKRQTTEGDTVVTELYTLDWSLMESEEIRLTLEDCDLTENGKRLFRSGMDRKDFGKAWGKLPPSWAAKIYACCMIVNPDWLVGELKPEAKEGITALGEAQEPQDASA